MCEVNWTLDATALGVAGRRRIDEYSMAGAPPLPILRRRLNATLIASAAPPRRRTVDSVAMVKGDDGTWHVL